MSEYIDREAAINAVFEAFADGRSAYIALEAIPAADVAPVVRCGDCKFYKNGMCYNPNTYDDEKTCGNTTPEWFCADGKRPNCGADMREGS